MKLIKIIFFSAVALIVSFAVEAASPIRYVQISTNTFTRQSGTARFQGADVSTTTVSSGTVVNQFVSSQTVTDQTVFRSTATWLSATDQTVTRSTVTWLSVTDQTVNRSTMTSLSFSDASTQKSASSIYRVLWASSTAAVSTTSTSFIDTPLMSTITLRSASNCVIASVAAILTSPSDTNNTMVTIANGATSLQGAVGGCISQTTQNTVSVRSTCSTFVSQCPGSAGPHTYKARVRVSGGTGIFNENVGGSLAVMTVQEYAP